MTSSIRNYLIIFKNFLNYLPSRFFVILNSLIIIPMFAYFLTTAQMSVFQISIGVLNLICTCSTDWIAKSVLRFYEKFRVHNSLDDFFSNISFLLIFSYILIFLCYLLFNNIVYEKLYVEPKIFLLTLILIIPFGIRQLLYQLLRIFKKPLLYTISIIIYQISLFILFLTLSKVFDNVFAILVAMAISAVIIDFIILKKINLKFSLTFKFNKIISQEVLIYALPLLITNLCIWLILHYNKFLLQSSHDFVSTALVGTSWLFVSNILTPLFSTLLFAIFPVIVKRFENMYKIKSFMTALMQIYIALFIPFVSIFCFFSKDITKIIFPSGYENLSILLPFAALTLFLHELMKLMNVKYHLQNKTYIETAVSLFVAPICLILNLIMINYFQLLGVGLAMLSSMSLLFLLNSFINFKSFEYLNAKKIFVSASLILLCGLISWGLSFMLFYAQLSAILIIIKIALFMFLYYFLMFLLKKQIFV